MSICKSCKQDRETYIEDLCVINESVDCHMNGPLEDKAKAAPECHERGFLGQSPLSLSISALPLPQLPAEEDINNTHIDGKHLFLWVFA